jgi:O-antigen/teichoic acid export membrane protein
MRYLSVLASNVFINVPTVLLVLMYSHLGTFQDSARLGTALAYVAPLFLLFSMQHGVAILAGKRMWTESTSLRAKLAPFYLVIALCISAIYNEYLILLVGLYRLGDLLYEPYFSEKIRATDYRGLFASSGSRLLVFLIGMCAIYLLKLDLMRAMMLLAVLNLIVTFGSCGFSWLRNSWKARLARADLLMGGGACLASLSVNVPRYFLGGAGAGDLAAYSNLLTIVMAATLVFVSFNNMYFARCARAGEEGVWRFFARSSVAGIVAASLLWVLVIHDFVVAKTLVRLALGERYLSYAGLVYLFWLFYWLLYLQNVANCVLIYAGAGRVILSSNVLLLVLLACGFVAIRSNISALSAAIIVNVSTAIFLMVAFSLTYKSLRRSGSMKQTQKMSEDHPV